MFRTIVGIIIGVTFSALVGATSFAVGEKFFGRGIGIFVSSPRLAAIFGAVFMGVPGLILGVLVGGFKTDVFKSAIIGLLIAVVTALLFAARNETGYFYESGYFDKERFWYDVIIYATWLVGLPLTAVIVSLSLRELFPRND